MRLLVLRTSSIALLMLRVMAVTVADRANRHKSAGPACISLTAVPVAPSGRWLSDWAGRKVMRSGSRMGLLSRASA